MGKAVCKASRKSSVQQKILLPIILATIVTIFSLHYYNQRHVERLMSKKMRTRLEHNRTLRHLIIDSTLHQKLRQSGLTNLSRESKPSDILHSVKSGISVPTDKQKVRQDLNNMESSRRHARSANNKVYGAAYSSPRKVFRNLSMQRASSIATPATMGSADEFSMKWNISTSGTPAKINLFRNPRQLNKTFNAKNSHGPVDTSNQNSSKTARETIDKYKAVTPTRITFHDMITREFRHTVRAQAKQVTKPAHFLEFSSSQFSYNQSQKDKWSPGMANEKKFNRSYNKLSLTQNKSKAIHIRKDKKTKVNVTRVSPLKLRFSKRQLLEIQPQIMIKSEANSLASNYQSKHNKSFPTAPEHQKGETFSLPEEKAGSPRELLNALASMLMPLKNNMQSNVNLTFEPIPKKYMSGERSQQLTSDRMKDKFANNLPLNSDLVLDKLSTSKLTKPPILVVPNLQQIWDNSVRELESIGLKNELHLTENMNHRKYSSDKLSLQEIWDESVSGNVLGPGKTQKVREVGTITTKIVTEFVSKDNLGNEQQNAVSPLLPADESKNSADLPPKSMRSKIMRFSYKPAPGKNYTVISVSVMGTDYNYAFTVPLTVLAWQRIGYGVIVFIVGSEENWVSNPILHYILKLLRRLNPVVLFLDAPKDNWVFLSQASRIFACNVFDWRGMEATPLVMSDTDIWPLTKEMYEIPNGMKILSVNSECCGSFKHQGQTYKMLPMCNIVMSVNMWRDLIGYRHGGFRPVSISDIMEYFHDEFGDIVKRAVSKGENNGWFLDQHMISVRIEQWAQNHGRESVQYVPRDVGRDRIDRSHWFPYRLSRNNDIHMLENLYQPGTWERALSLLREMFNEKTNIELEQYRDGFIRMLINYKVPP